MLAQVEHAAVRVVVGAARLAVGARGGEGSCGGRRAPLGELLALAAAACPHLGVGLVAAGR